MSDQQGTGKHPHKSAAEPYEHHNSDSSANGKHEPAKTEAAKTEPAKHEPAKAESGSHEQGTGKHPHKKASDPQEHHEGAKK